MYQLHNAQLTVDLLDPVADRARLGPRYCVGGYVFQVKDHRGRPLLSGPEYPSPAPTGTGGQGLPEVFQFTLYNEERELEDRKLIIGVGLVDKIRPELPYHLFTNAQTVAYADWQVEQTGTSLRMTTVQTFKQWSFRLVREVRLENKSLSSSTLLYNTGNTPLPFRWFAHPFFPLVDAGRCCQLAGLTTLPENPGFRLEADGFIVMNPEYNWPEGCYVKFETLNGKPLNARQAHDLCGELRVTGNFPLSDLALWANERTFSFEPFYQRTVPPQQETAWTIVYHF
ncbi:MAG: hypothetical protein ONB48_20265 [candidate division KSB1 bacterium]|nr:hypothetical protein [candidate division KSB1 bacterium]MDZ7276211.1 hypothetical protein [candidate division KSB1 bacterium]MDZ7287983.1 hypothetical protein [candidate division KSB1 bacterium]MDZ7300004.1 hypothetical protein [candidate division KSB1 bacterium]MDZ7308243.1 hypothetical protein [candidate division KSB1 bacterium]